MKENKSQKIRELLAQDKSPKEICSELGVSKSNIYAVKRRDKKKAETKRMRIEQLLSDGFTAKEVASMVKTSPAYVYQIKKLNSPDPVKNPVSFWKKFLNLLKGI